MANGRWWSVLFGMASLAMVCRARAADNETRRNCDAHGGRPSLDGCVETTKHARLQKVPGAPSKTSGGDEARKAKQPAISGDTFRPAKPLLAQRSKALLIGEIYRLEALLDKTRRKSPDRPMLVRRIADDYAELAAISEREKIASEVRAESAAKVEKARSERAKLRVKLAR